MGNLLAYRRKTCYNTKAACFPTGGKALHNGRRLAPPPKGGETMRFTVTFYVGRKTITLSLVVKSKPPRRENIPAGRFVVGAGTLWLRQRTTGRRRRRPLQPSGKFFANHCEHRRGGVLLRPWSFAAAATLPGGVGAPRPTYNDTVACRAACPHAAGKCGDCCHVRFCRGFGQIKEPPLCQVTTLRFHI